MLLNDFFQGLYLVGHNSENLLFSQNLVKVWKSCLCSGPKNTYKIKIISTIIAVSTRCCLCVWKGNFRMYCFSQSVCCRHSFSNFNITSDKYIYIKSVSFCSYEAGKILTEISWKLSIIPVITNIRNQRCALYRTPCSHGSGKANAKWSKPIQYSSFNRTML